MGDQPTFQMAIPASNFRCWCVWLDSSPVPVKPYKVSVELAGRSAPQFALKARLPVRCRRIRVFSARFAVHLPDDAPYTRPYFERPGLEQPYYTFRERKIVIVLWRPILSKRAPPRRITACKSTSLKRCKRSSATQAQASSSIRCRWTGHLSLHAAKRGHRSAGDDFVPCHRARA